MPANAFFQSNKDNFLNIQLQLIWLLINGGINISMNRYAHILFQNMNIE